MRPKLQKQSALKLAGRIIPRSRGQRDLPRITALSSPGRSRGISSRGIKNTDENMNKTIPLAEAKKNLSALIRDVEEKYDRFTITKNGVNEAILLSCDEFDGLLETLDILSSKEEKEALARAKNQVKNGKTISLAAIKKKYNLP
jgi:prevent-host-death family protein